MRERQQRIYELVNKQGNATIEQLKQTVFASEATIRRDLDKMEKQTMTMLMCTGGAALIIMLIASFSMIGGLSKQRVKQ